LCTAALHLHAMGAALLHQFATYHIGVCGLAGVSMFIHTALSMYGTDCFPLQTPYDAQLMHVRPALSLAAAGSDWTCFAGSADMMHTRPHSSGCCYCQPHHTITKSSSAPVQPAQPDPHLHSLQCSPVPNHVQNAAHAGSGCQRY
jgi:hypothetical protein